MDQLPWYDDPDISEEQAQAMWEHTKQMILLGARLGPTPGGKYVTRESVERRVLREAEQSASREISEVVWDAIRGQRMRTKDLPLRDAQGLPFRLPFDSYSPLVLSVDHALSTFEHRVGWGLGWERREIIPQGMRDDAIREEAIASCRLDGLGVDRNSAREMLATGRPPATPVEDAVRRTYDVLLHAVPSLLGARWDPIRPDQLLELNAWLVESSHRGARARDQLRTSPFVDEPGAAPGDVAPPAPEEIADRLEALCTFFSSTNDSRHPLLNAVLFHFWIAYERPFAHANGRTARALFYAYLSRYYRSYLGTPESVSALRIVPISPRLSRMTATYAELFRLATRDGNDVGYFVHAQLRVINRAADEAAKALEAQDRVRRVLREMLPSFELNDRQLDALARTLQRPGLSISIEDHRRRYGVVYQTARTDLMGLADVGLMLQTKQGRAFVFQIMPNFAERLNETE